MKTDTIASVGLLAAVGVGVFWFAKTFGLLPATPTPAIPGSDEAIQDTANPDHFGEGSPVLDPVWHSGNTLAQWLHNLGTGQTGMGSEDNPLNNPAVTVGNNLGVGPFPDIGPFNFVYTWAEGLNNLFGGALVPQQPVGDPPSAVDGAEFTPPGTVINDNVTSYGTGTWAHVQEVMSQVGYFTTPTDLPGRPGWHFWYDVQGGGSELFVQEPGGLMFEGAPAECIARGGDWWPGRYPGGCSI